MITISERREHESAKSFVLRVLIDNIINTRLEPGEKLNEPELCEQLGVSRTPFREAELELAQRRLIEIRPKIGTYVSLIDAELVEEVRHLRAVLEAEIARLEAAVQEAQDQLAAPEAVSDFERLTELTEQISGYEQALEAAYQEWDRLLSR